MPRAKPPSSAVCASPRASTISLTELDADRTLATAEAQLAQSEQLVAQDQVTLFRALGGGWEDSGDTRGDAKPTFDGSARRPG